VRRISTELRPSILDDLGFITAMEWQSEEFEKRSGIKVHFEKKENEITLSPKTSIALFRIYQELLTNVARHANGDTVRSSVYINDKHLYLSVIDNGIGFEVENISSKKTLGLLGIKERTLLLQGTYEIQSTPGKGTMVTIAVPLESVFP
jgi:signal transduction histidine kinase